MAIVHKHFSMGQAPYRYIGLWSAPSKGIQEANPSAYNNMMASRPKCCHFSCDHCGIGIEHHCIIQDATGAKFCIGSDCLQKLDDVENVSQAVADKKAREKAARKVKADAKREAQRQAREDEMQRQRDANGGLTDWEVQDKARLDAITAKRNEAVADAEYFIIALAQSGSFGQELARSLGDKKIPYGRGESIMLDMVTKHYAGTNRAGTKKFDAEYPNTEAKLGELKAKWEVAA